MMIYNNDNSCCNYNNNSNNDKIIIELYELTGEYAVSVPQTVVTPVTAASHAVSLQITSWLLIFIYTVLVVMKTCDFAFYWRCKQPVS